MPKPLKNSMGARTVKGLSVGSLYLFYGAYKSTNSLWHFYNASHRPNFVTLQVAWGRHLLYPLCLSYGACKHGCTLNRGVFFHCLNVKFVSNMGGLHLNIKNHKFNFFSGTFWLVSPLFIRFTLAMSIGLHLHYILFVL